MHPGQMATVPHVLLPHRTRSPQCGGHVRQCCWFLFAKAPGHEDTAGRQSRAASRLVLAGDGAQGTYRKCLSTGGQGSSCPNMWLGVGGLGTVGMRTADGRAWASVKISVGSGVWVSPGVRGRGSSDVEEGVRTGLPRASVEGGGGWRGICSG